MHEEQQPPEYHGAWSASPDSAGDPVTPSGADDQAPRGDAAAPGGQPAQDAAPAWQPPAAQEPGSGQPPAGGHEQPTMIYAPPGSYLPPGADEPGAGGAGYGGASYGSAGYGGAGYGGQGHEGAGYGAAGYGGAGYGGGQGYEGAGYGGAGYGGAGYGGAGYGGPGYPGGAEYGGYGPGGPYQPGGPGYGLPGDIIGGGYGQERPPRRGSRIVTYVVVAALAAGVGAGTVLALNHNSADSSPSISLPGPGSVPQPGSGAGPGGSTNANNSTVQSVNRKVSPGIVDVISRPAYQNGTLEGTGMILSRDGLVLTNNHVVEGTNQIVAKLANNVSKTYQVTVLGTDATDDVALLRLVGATSLTPVPLGNSQQVRVGDAVVALGNADGQDGKPTVVTGHITGLDQSIKASDQGAGTTENLHNMLETNAPIISGDSGGALANTQGRVIGMNTAANSTPLGGGGGSTGFAIPIDRALTIARQIAAGHATSSIQIGLPAFLGVTVARQASGNGSSTATSPRAQLQQLKQAAQTQNGFGGFGGTPGGSSGGSSGCQQNNDSFSVPSHIPNVSSGALISGVLCDTPVASAGLTAGSVITGINGHSITSPATLTQTLTGYHPGNTISVTWVAPTGQQHTSSLKLAAGPAK